jgi:hypothetical protein
MFKLFMVRGEDDTGGPILEQAREAMGPQEAKAYREACEAGQKDEICRTCKAVWLAHKVGVAMCPQDRGSHCFYAKSPLDRKGILTPRPGGQIGIPV